VPEPRRREGDPDRLERSSAAPWPDITDPAHLARLRSLPLSPWAPGDKARYVRVRPRAISGRRVRIPDDLPLDL
jgi:hypothetical protein